MTAPFQLHDTPLPPGTTLLEASAGTGKTYALAALVLRLVAEEGLGIGQILITTYTIPATAELRDRIRARLEEAVTALGGGTGKTPFIIEFAARHAGNAAALERLREALRDFDLATISTIHGFCQRMLLQHSFESGTDPGAELLPDQHALITQAAEDYWRLHFSGDQPGLTPVAILTGLTPEKLARLFAETSQFPGRILRPAPMELAAAADTFTALLAELRREWPAWSAQARALFLPPQPWAIGDWKKEHIIAPVFEQAASLATDAIASHSCYSATDWFAPSVIIQGKGLAKKASLPRHPFMDWCEQFLAAKNAVAAAIRSHFVASAADLLAARKAEDGLLSFDDLLTRFHAALERGPALADAVRTRFRAALVDEFQDTDPVQAAIFQRLFTGSDQRLFLIGDPKQAIFAFRGADLHAYLGAREKAGRHFRLDTNHRSDAPLVAAVNRIFSRAGSRVFVDPRVEFEPVNAARSERPLTGNAAPLRFWFWRSDDPIAATSADDRIVDFTADEIYRQLRSRKLDGRALLPRDCAILCDANARCVKMQAALHARGIPAVVLSNASVFASPDAADLHVLLAALANPAREPLVRAALATALFSNDAAALAALADDAAAWERELVRMQEWARLWRENGFIRMFRELLHAAHVRSRLLSQPDGERRLTNLLHLAELLHGTAREFQFGPDALLRWFSAQLSEPPEADEYELRLERDDDAVKILTMHKSKGLEWPVVFCPFLWRNADLRDGATPAFHDDLGRIVLDLGTPEHATATAAAETELLAEKMRLLYVALTRARHECHVVWGLFNKSANSPLMWLLEGSGCQNSTASPVVALRAHAGFTSDGLRRTLDTLAAEAPAEISVADFPTDDTPPCMWRRADAEPTTAGALTFGGRIDRSWRLTSFTALTAAEIESDADYDAHPSAPTPGPRLGIHAFPGGMKAGRCVHDIMEHLDFTRPGDIAPLVAAKLRVHGLHTPDNEQSLRDTVRRLLALPLDDTEPPVRRARRHRDDNTLELALGLPVQTGTAPTLGSIPMARTLREIEFHLPAARLTPGELARFTAGSVSFDPHRGVLKGVLDLVFEHDGRFHILDWKTNTLGTDAAAYTRDAMAAEIAHHRYDLQWSLYLVALHRFLRVRLRDAYDPARHLGGVHYVFIRGVEPTNPRTGVFRTQPDLVKLAELDAVFSGE